MKRRILMAIIAFYCACLVLFLMRDSFSLGFPIYHHYVTKHLSETGAENIVSAIYMFYRYFDTIFESLTFLFAVIAVIYLSIHESGDTYE